MSSNKTLSKMHQRLNTKAEDRTALGADSDLDTTPREKNTFWDDATDLYQKSILAIEQTHGQLAMFLQVVVADPKRLALIEDAQTLISNINLLERDIGEHVGRLNAIYETHKHQSGGTTTPDEGMAVISIHGQYHDALHVYDTTIMPTVAHIFEQVGAVEDLLLSEQKAAEEAAKVALVDPTVISDVQVKEVQIEG